MRTYYGTIRDIKLLHTTAFGHRVWQIIFAGGVYVTFMNSTKQTLYFKVGDKIRFTGHYFGHKDEFFEIDEIVDINDAELAQMHFLAMES